MRGHLIYLRFFASLRMTRKSVDGRRFKNGLPVVILRSLPQADDEESKRDMKRAWKLFGRWQAVNE